MNWTLLTGQQESFRAFETFRATFSEGAHFFPKHMLGWQSNSGKFDLFWHPNLKVWGVLEPHPPKSTGSRFWLCFGNDHPDQHRMLSITVEINPPHEGLNFRLGGAFVQDHNGVIHLAHSGRVGGGRKGIGKKNFLASYPRQHMIFVRERGTDMIDLGNISNSDVKKNIAMFVSHVRDFKDSIQKT